MKKHILNIILGIATTIIVSGQVGIQTDTPKADLHINGNLQLTNELKVGGTANSEGYSGTDGQVLISNGNGNATNWVTLEEIPELPMISMIANRRTLTTHNAANSTTKVPYTSFPKSISSLVTYNSSSQEFIIHKSGYYKITTLLSYNMEDNNSGQTSGAGRSTIVKNGIVFISSAYSTHGERTNNIYHNVSGTAYFEVGDRISVNAMYTQRYRLGNSSITITYLLDE